MLVLGCEPLDDAPILDLRIRKGVRRHGVKLAVATARPSALDPNAKLVVRYAPGDEAAFLRRARGRARGRRAPSERSGPGRAAARRRRGRRDRVGRAARRRPPAATLLADRRGGSGWPAATARACSRSRGRQRPRPARGGRAARTPAPATSELAAPGRGARGDRRRPPRAGELTALYLFQTDPAPRPARPRGRGSRRCTAPALVVAHASVLTDGLREHANVVFPAESYAEKEGTVVHPDGRLQRLRPAIAHPGEVAAGWSVLAELASAAGSTRRARRAAWRSSSCSRRCRSTRA